MQARIMMYTELDTSTKIKEIIAQKEKLCKSGWTLERKWTTTYSQGKRTLKIRFAIKKKGQRGRTITFQTSDLSEESLNKLSSEISGSGLIYLDSYLDSDRSEKYTYNYKLYVLFLYK